MVCMRFLGFMLRKVFRVFLVLLMLLWLVWMMVIRWCDFISLGLRLCVLVKSVSVFFFFVVLD